MKRLPIAIFCVMLLLCSCAREQPVAATPGSTLPGFWSSGQQVEGGSDVEGLNLRSVSAAVNGGVTMLSLSFVTGSIRAGGEEKPLNQTPSYKIEALEGPGRLLITLPIEYSDYQGNEPEPAGLFTAMYAIPGAREEGGTRVYFQFTGKIGFQVDEQKGALLLNIEPENPDEGDRFFTSVAYDSSTSAIALENGLHPVLCDDGESMLFLSDPFEDNTSADELTNLLNERLGRENVNHRAGVILLSGNWAPTYEANISRDELEQLGALFTPDEELLSAEPFAVNARFLTWTAEGSGLCAQPVTHMESGELTNYEQLWVYDAQGGRTRFIDSEFAYIDRALFSKDGRYLAFIERVESKRLLYLFDTEENKLEFLSAEGMGDFTASFDWSDEGKLYALSGTESMQLMCFDPAPTDEGISRVSAVEERYGGAGSVYCAGSLVYFNGDVAGVIFAIDPKTGEREEFAQGDGFSISPDGKVMLISYYEPEAGVDSQTGVKVRDMATGEEKELTSGFTYHGNCWSRDGALLSYLVGNYTVLDVFADEDSDVVEFTGAQGDEYPARLYTYNPAADDFRLEGMLASDSIYPGRTGNEVVLVAYHQRENHTSVPITYLLSLSAR